MAPVRRSSKSRSTSRAPAARASAAGSSVISKVRTFVNNKYRDVTSSVFMYVPNLIGYTRVVCLIYALQHAFNCWSGFLGFYTAGALLDAVDGWAARKMKQETKFGAVLDMVTDRVSTNMLYFVLAILFSEKYMMIGLLAALDYASHWFRMYAASMTGAHHKTMGASRNWLLRMYYTKKAFMLVCCVAQEAYLLAMYASHWASKGARMNVFGVTDLGMVAECAMMISMPFAALKQLINVIQLVDASIDIADRR
jgi:CDP-diacylglycerol--inositol 3-phosphatidyltransferase